MNHREEPLNNRTRKKVTKEVRSAQKTTKAEASSQPSNRNLRGQNLAKRPHKVLKREESMLTKLKNLIKRKKTPAKHSKRTTPGIENESAPSYPHKEGARWIQTVEKQTLDRSKTLVAKLSKRKVKR